MDRFVKLTVVGKLGNETERIFNLRFVRAVDAEKRTVLLEGNKKPFVVMEESAKRLVEVLENIPSSTQVVADLQRDLSFAENICSAVVGMTLQRDHYKDFPVFINGTRDVSGIFDAAYDAVKEKMLEFDKLEAENEQLKAQLGMKDETGEKVSWWKKLFNLK